jgi:hypothetical protein
MCPVCLATAILVTAGAASAGGLAAMAARGLRPKSGRPFRDPRTDPNTETQGDDHDASDRSEAE